MSAKNTPTPTPTSPVRAAATAAVEANQRAAKRDNREHRGTGGDAHPFTTPGLENRVTPTRVPSIERLLNPEPDSEAIKRLLVDRRKVLAMADRLVASVRDGDADDDPTTRATFERLMAEVDAIDDHVHEARELAVEQRQHAEMTGTSLAAQVSDTGRARSDRDLRAMLCGERPDLDVTLERRDLTVGVDAAGGYTVGETFHRAVVRHLTDRSPILRVARVVTTQAGEDLAVPTSTAFGTAAAVAEAGTIGEDDPTLAQVVFGSHKYAKLLQVSNELLADTMVDLTDFIAADAAEAIAAVVEPAWITGTGSGEPHGVATAATTGVTAASATAVTLDELLDLQHSVIDAYRRSPSCAWLMNDATYAEVRKLTDDNNRYQLEPAPALGQPSTLFGHPVYTDPNVAAMTTGNKAVLFGDFSRFWVRIVRGLRFESSRDYAFDKDLATYRVLLRTDSKLIDTSAIKALVLA